jgi:hypothetical protein
LKVWVRLIKGEISKGSHFGDEYRFGDVPRFGEVPRFGNVPHLGEIIPLLGENPCFGEAPHFGEIDFRFHLLDFILLDCRGSIFY